MLTQQGVIRLYLRRSRCGAVSRCPAAGLVAQNAEQVCESRNESRLFRESSKSTHYLICQQALNYKRRPCFYRRRARPVLASLGVPMVDAGQIVEGQAWASRSWSNRGGAGLGVKKSGRETFPSHRTARGFRLACGVSVPTSATATHCDRSVGKRR